MKTENITKAAIEYYYELCGHEQDFHNELQRMKKEYFADEGIELCDDEVIEKIKLDYSLYYPELVNSTRCIVLDTLKGYLTNTESNTHNINKSFEKCIHTARAYKKEIQKEIEKAQDAINQLNDLIDICDKYREK